MGDTIVFQVTSGRGLDPRRPLSLTIFPRRLATTYGNYSLPVDASNDPQQLVVQRIQFMIRRKSVQPRQYGNLGTNSVFGYPVRISRKNDIGKNDKNQWEEEWLERRGRRAR